MRILALDLGQRVGWAVGYDGAIIAHGSHRFNWFPDFMLGKRLGIFEAWLCTKLVDFPLLHAVVYEQPHHRGGASTRQLLGMASILEFWAYRRELDCFGCHSSTLKKHATGSGRTKGKGPMIARACELTGKQIVDDNEADAICALHYAFSLPAIPRTA